jgi:hypothetical protein
MRAFTERESPEKSAEVEKQSNFFLSLFRIKFVVCQHGFSFVDDFCFN